MDVVWLHDISSSNELTVGGKGAHLGRLMRAGITVPPGFCVGTGAYDSFVQQPIMRAAVLELFRALDILDLSQLGVKCLEIQRACLDSALPAGLQEQVASAYQQLGKITGYPAPKVAVRSSATLEDTAANSFAGQYESYLNVSGEEELLDHIKRCWASMWTPHALFYMVSSGAEYQNANMAVVVQQLVSPLASGVIFTANPITGNLSELIINSSWGLGESVVQGEVAPDAFIVDKESKSITSRIISSKLITIEPTDNQGTIKREVPGHMQDISSLTDEQIYQLREVALKIEELYESPMDIEWCCHNDRIYIVQARPITTLGSFPIV